MQWIVCTPNKMKKISLIFLLFIIFFVLYSLINYIDKKEKITTLENRIIDLEIQKINYRKIGLYLLNFLLTRN